MQQNNRDLEYLGFRLDVGKYVVKEELFPEVRGFIYHTFDTKDEALAMLAGNTTRKAG